MNLYSIGTDSSGLATVTDTAAARGGVPSSYWTESNTGGRADSEADREEHSARRPVPPKVRKK